MGPWYGCMWDGEEARADSWAGQGQWRWRKQVSLVAFWTWQDLLRDCEGGGSRNPELPLGLGTED